MLVRSSRLRQSACQRSYREEYAQPEPGSAVADDEAREKARAATRGLQAVQGISVAQDGFRDERPDRQRIRRDQSGAPRNRTLTCTPEELLTFSKSILRIETAIGRQDIDCQLIGGDFFEIATHLPTQFIDLLILDPPYNLTKNYNGNHFRKLNKADYVSWFEKVIELLTPMMKPTATIYVCSDWKTSTLVLPVLEKRFFVQNRITWEREKGRGARRNWKNNVEDIWFCTNSENYYFDVEAVKLKRKVLAPYRVNGDPKDWKHESDGNFRLTHPSNIWTDLTVPFWSMPENTPHPTQKPENYLRN